VARLHRSGWNHICRLGDLEATLKKIFALKGKIKDAAAKRVTIGLDEDDEDA
jgi:hypothetical protein